MLVGLSNWTQPWSSFCIIYFDPNIILGKYCLSCSAVCINSWLSCLWYWWVRWWMVSPTGNCDSCYDILVVIHCQKMYFKHVACMGNFFFENEGFSQWSNDSNNNYHNYQQWPEKALEILQHRWTSGGWYRSRNISSKGLHNIVHTQLFTCVIMPVISSLLVSYFTNIFVEVSWIMNI